MTNKTKTLIASAAIAGLLSGATFAGTLENGKADSRLAGMEKMSCNGKESCKGKSECKSKSDCKSKDKNSCKSNDNSCKAKDSCKSKDGCKGSSDKKD